MSDSDIDFVALRDEVREAARHAFTQVRQAHADERFYAFALFTDDEGMTIGPAANSEEGFERMLQEASSGGAGEMSAYRWSTAEWAYEDDDTDAFTAICSKLFKASMDAEDFKEFRKSVRKTMVQALADLNTEEFFGSGAEREQVTVFCSISDSDRAIKFEDESSQKLNPASVSEVFLRRWEA